MEEGEAEDRGPGLGGGDRVRLRLSEDNDESSEDGGLVEAAEGGAVELVHPELADGEEGGEAVEEDSDEALARSVVGQAGQQILH